MTGTMIRRVQGSLPRAVHFGASAGIFFPSGGSSVPQGPARTSGFPGRGEASRQASRQLALPPARSCCRLLRQRARDVGLRPRQRGKRIRTEGCCMDEGRASRTAIATAYFRAHHCAHASPKIFEDSLAGALLSAKEREAMERFLLEGLVKYNPELARSGADRATLVGYALRGLVVVLARARYTEDRLAEAMRGGVSQYVIIGAGLDTFALRRPDLQDRLRIIEIDHPATQAFKQKRIREAGLTPPPNLHFAPADSGKGEPCGGPVADALRSGTAGVLLVAGGHHVPDGRCDPGNASLPARLGRRRQPTGVRLSRPCRLGTRKPVAHIQQAHRNRQDAWGSP